MMFVVAVSVEAMALYCFLSHSFTISYLLTMLNNFPFSINIVNNATYVMLTYIAGDEQKETTK